MIHLLFLLTIEISVAYWLSVIATAGIGFVSFLLVNLYKDIKESVKKNEEDIKHLNESFNDEKLLTEQKMSEMKIIILESLNDIKKDFYELRK